MRLPAAATGRSHARVTVVIAALRSQFPGRTVPAGRGVAAVAEGDAVAAALTAAAAMEGEAGIGAETEA